MVTIQTCQPVPITDWWPHHWTIMWPESTWHCSTAPCSHPPCSCSACCTSPRARWVISATTLAPSAWMTPRVSIYNLHRYLHRYLDRVWPLMLYLLIWQWTRCSATAGARTRPWRPTCAWRTACGSSSISDTTRTCSSGSRRAACASADTTTRSRRLLAWCRTSRTTCASTTAAAAPAPTARCTSAAGSSAASPSTTRWLVWRCTLLCRHQPHWLTEWKMESG